MATSLGVTGGEKEDMVVVVGLRVLRDIVSGERRDLYMGEELFRV